MAALWWVSSDSQKEVKSRLAFDNICKTASADESGYWGVSVSSDLLLSSHEAFIYSKQRKKEKNGDELDVIVLPE